MQLSRLYNKRVQNEANGSLEGSGTRVEPLATAGEACRAQHHACRCAV